MIESKLMEYIESNIIKLYFPIFIHGLFDFFLMLGETIEINGLFYLAIIDLFFTYIYTFDINFRKRITIGRYSL